MVSGNSLTGKDETRVILQLEFCSKVRLPTLTFHKVAAVGKIGSLLNHRLTSRLPYNKLSDMVYHFSQRAREYLGHVVKDDNPEG